MGADKRVPGGPLDCLYRHSTARGFPDEYQENQRDIRRTRTTPGKSKVYQENQNNTRKIREISGEPEQHQENQRDIRRTRVYQEKFRLPRILPYKPTFIWNLNSDEYRARFHLFYVFPMLRDSQSYIETII